MPKYRAIVMILDISKPKMVKGTKMFPTLFKAKIDVEAVDDAAASTIGRKAAGTIGNFEAEVQTDV